jgi:peptide/nickel transport system permease protein
VVFLEVIIGIVLGSVSGYYGGRTDSVIMRITEIFMCFPFLMICITIIAIFGSSVRNLVLVLALLGWPGIARIVRGQILSLKELEFMEACEALGISDSKRIFKHLLPNVMASVIVFSTLGMASVILTETALSFLGLGVSATTPTWGNMIQIARNLYIIQGRAWQWIPPGVAIFVTVLAFNLLGDGLRDALDPKLKQ